MRTIDFRAGGDPRHTDRMRVTPRRLAIGMSLWAPNLFSGIRVRRIAEDWTSATVELHVNLFTRNYVKTAFGGSMSAMTDPYFFMLVMHQLGRDHVVWDTRGEIEFVRPGRGVLTAHFEVPREKADELRERVARRRQGARVVRDRDHGCRGRGRRTGATRGLRAREAPSHGVLGSTGEPAAQASGLISRTLAIRCRPTRSRTRCSRRMPRARAAP